jgi:hypothetical protein
LHHRRNARTAQPAHFGVSGGLQLTRCWRKADSNSRSHLTGQCQKMDGSPYRVRPRRALAHLLQLEEQPTAAL